MGNLIPALFWFPPAAVALIELVSGGRFDGEVLGLLVLSTVLGWSAVNRFGLFQNLAMRKQLERILKTEERDLAGEMFFVGFASPTYSSMLDAHQDVGFLCLRADKLAFLSEQRTIEIAKADVATIRFRANVHSVIGLGRWISVEGTVGGTSIRLLIEPREKTTLLGNRRYGAKLIAILREWHQTRK